MSSLLKKSNHYTILLIKHLVTSIDLALSDLCYEYSHDDVSLNSFHCIFVHKELRSTYKTEIKGGLQYADKKLSLLGDIIIYIHLGFSNELETVHFLNHEALRS